MVARLPLLAGLLALALALGLGSFAIADGIRNRNRNDVIVVTGSAKRRVSADYATWRASVTSQGPTTAAAAHALGRLTRRVRSFLHDAGARDAETSVAPISVTALRRRSVVTGYRLTRQFTVRSARVQVVVALAERSSSLLESGIPFTPQPVRYLYTKLPSLRPQLLADAAHDAQRRARALVEATGGDLGTIRRVEVGVFQVTAPNSTAVSDYGVYDTSTREKDVTAVVNATFALR